MRTGIDEPRPAVWCGEYHFEREDACLPEAARLADAYVTRNITDRARQQSFHSQLARLRGVRRSKHRRCSTSLSIGGQTRIVSLVLCIDLDPPSAR